MTYFVHSKDKCSCMHAWNKHTKSKINDTCYLFGLVKFFELKPAVAFFPLKLNAFYYQVFCLMCFQQHTLYYTEQIAGAENVKKKKNH